MTEEKVRGGFARSELRSTRQRRAVAAAVADLDSFTSTQAVYERMKLRGEKIGLSTVYRNLQALAEVGEVDSVRNSDGEILYRRCGEVHHHHVVCRRCGSAEEVTEGAVERWISQAASEFGFTEVTHEMEVFGICPDCKAAEISRTDRKPT